MVRWVFLEARLEWGIKGVAAAMRRGDVIIIVDVIRFTSAVVSAASKGHEVVPMPTDAEARDFAKENGLPHFDGMGALCPKNFFGIASKRIVLPSPNGATLSYNASGNGGAFIASYLNATAAAEEAYESAARAGKNLSFIASGEVGDERRVWLPEWERALAGGNELFCVEDFMCAGLVASKIAAEKSPELLSAEMEFQKNAGRLRRTLEESASGIEVMLAGHHEDVTAYSHVDAYRVAPRLSMEGKIPVIRPGLKE